MNIKDRLVSWLKGSLIGLSVLSMIIFVRNISPAFAQTQIPSFPSCTELVPPGDVAHYSYGWHQIVGGDLLEGSDDVYSVDEKNYVQCFCDVEKISGIQTNWWNASDLSEEEINQYKNNGWFVENGVVWNLGDYTYLAQNIDYSCSVNEPSPTPITTVTPTPTATPTPGDKGYESYCSGLSASPASGTAPLTVKFNASAYDSRGPIQLYRFDFGDDSGNQPQVWEQKENDAYHRYENPGEYTVTVSAKDFGGDWQGGNESCSVKVTVASVPQVLGGSTTNELPKTGSSATLGIGVIALSSLGAVLYRRSKLV